jgi:hypothetical protein
MVDDKLKECRTLDIEQILMELKRERDRLGRAIEALDGNRSSRPTAKAATSISGTTAKTRGRLTPAGRKKLSEAMKKRWAERRKKG